MRGLKKFLGVFLVVAATIAEAGPCSLSADGQRLNCPEGVYEKGADGTYYPAGNQQGGHTQPSRSSASPAGQHGTPQGRLVSTSPAASPTAPVFKGPSTRGTANPGWAFDMLSNAGKKLTSCAATLFEVSGGVCRALSAAHCFEKVLASAARDIAKQGCSIDAGPVNKEGVLTTRFRMNSEATGVVDAKVHINDSYYDKDQGDMAVIEWACAAQPAIKAVPLCTTGPREGEPVQYGKVMGQKGLYSGRVRLNHSFVTREGLQASQSSSSGTLEVNQFGPKTQNGDSGGPLVKTNEQCLLAALSGEAFYDTGAIALYGTSEIGGQQSTSALQFAMKTRQGGARDLTSSLASAK